MSRFCDTARNAFAICVISTLIVHIPFTALAQNAATGTEPAAPTTVPPPPPPAPVATAATEAAPKAEDKPAKPAEKKWYEKLSLRGYMQLRYNRLGETNPNLLNDQGDKSLGAGNGFFIRRLRLVFSGDITDHLYIYIQPDFAAAISDSFNVGMLRDAYADISFDAKKEFRLRIGQSKVPYGFENMQSSQNRLPFDRSDAINSALYNERDVGLFFYWAPAEIRARFKHLVDSGLKGSGDYGVFGLGVYNGQGANVRERNDHLHTVARLTWPFQLGNQILEVGGGGYIGRYTIKTAKPQENARTEYDDMRASIGFTLYPQPFGLQAEYNIGKGPQLNGDGISVSSLQGGYVLASYNVGSIGSVIPGTFIPYVRGVYYDGGKKFETNAPHYLVRELETGVEWQISKMFELTGAYWMSDRTSPAAPYKQEKGRTVRLQLQVNY